MWALLLLLGTAPPPDYSTVIKPILALRCRACHGGLNQKGGFRTDTAAFLLEGGNSGPSLVAGNSAESPLVRRIQKQDGKQRMPPEHEGEIVSAADLDLVKRWIDAGAKAPLVEKAESDPSTHWAFQPPKKSAIDSMNPIDSILGKARKEKNIPTASRAPSGLFWRRLFIDLTGLPPTREQLAVLADPKAIVQTADKLLASDAHAERWARHFMDIWRYSDWWGLGAEVRNSQKHIWHWRDWIIDSIRSDKPYDQMIREMLAADELYPTDQEKLRATGLLVRPYFIFNRNSWMEETIEHLGKGFLGLTLNCARCHDHKYDPISQVDYYRFRAIFEPYQIRRDLLGGELDPEKDALPRIFDCNLDLKTRRFIRGDEANPDTAKVMEPGVPAVLGMIPFNPKPIPLAQQVYQPGLNPRVIKAYQDRTGEQLGQEEKALATARKSLENAKSQATTPKPTQKSPTLLTKGFGNPPLWKVQSGTWMLTPTQATQSNTKDLRTELIYLGPPLGDFELKAKIRITGGDPYRSVGFAFDASDANENLLYASANAPDPKIQFSTIRAGVATYPEKGRVSKPIALNQDFTLRIRVQGTTMLVDYDGSQILAYTLPKDRSPGLLKCITYTATTQIFDFELWELPSGTHLNNKAPSVETLAKQVKAHEAKCLALRTDLVGFEPLLAAMQNPTALTTQTAAKAQIESESLHAQADLAKLIAEGASSEKIKAQEKIVSEVAKKKLKPGNAFKPLVGSYKSKESNQESQDSLDKPFPNQSSGRRTALAQWLTSQKHPLTARVIVNHVWTRHMGQPLVKSVFDFGRKGKAPLNQELLDWLALDLMEHNYSLRHLHRMIVTSNTYALAADPPIDHPGWKQDPENRTFWYKVSQRLESESIRDGLLSLSGTLDPKVGGPTISSNDLQSSRRSLYFFHSHNEDQRFLAQFDSPNVLDCYRREESIVPQQALALFNSKLSRDLSQKIAEKVAPKGSLMTAEDFVSHAFPWILGHPPSGLEKIACVEAMEAWSKAFPKDPQRPRINLIHTLINHNDFITLR